MLEHCNLMSMYIYSKSKIYFSECSGVPWRPYCGASSLIWQHRRLIRQKIYTIVIVNLTWIVYMYTLASESLTWILKHAHWFAMFSHSTLKYAFVNVYVHANFGILLQFELLSGDIHGENI